MLRSCALFLVHAGDSACFQFWRYMLFLFHCNKNDVIMHSCTSPYLRLTINAHVVSSRTAMTVEASNGNHQEDKLLTTTTML